MLENKRIQKPREFWISTSYFRASTVYKNIYIFNFLYPDTAFECSELIKADNEECQLHSRQDQEPLHARRRRPFGARPVLVGLLLLILANRDAKDSLGSTLRVMNERKRVGHSLHTTNISHAVVRHSRNKERVKRVKQKFFYREGRRQKLNKWSGLLNGVTH